MQIQNIQIEKENHTSYKTARIVILITLTDDEYPSGSLSKRDKIARRQNKDLERIESREVSWRGRAAADI